jgi:hypothetical protein
MSMSHQRLFVTAKAAFGYKVRNQRYREDQQISDVVASRDLKKLARQDS